MLVNINPNPRDFCLLNDEFILVYLCDAVLNASINDFPTRVRVENYIWSFAP